MRLNALKYFNFGLEWVTLARHAPLIIWNHDEAVMSPPCHVSSAKVSNIANYACEKMTDGTQTKTRSRIEMEASR